MKAGKINEIKFYKFNHLRIERMGYEKGQQKLLFKIGK
jgi:hypothetical protein